MNSKKIIETLTSLRFTVFCMGLSLALVVIGTLAQVDMGTFAAQKKFFNHFFIYGPYVGSTRIPVFPGGLFVGMLWFVNLAAMMIFRMRYHRRNTGLVLIHAGLLFLLVGQFFTQIWGKESRLSFEEGETKNYIESSQKIELAVVMVSDPSKDNVVSIPPKLLRQGGDISTPHLPFTLRVRRYFENSSIRMKKDDEAPIATQGVGVQLATEPQPVTTKDDETNNTSVVFEILKSKESLGSWVVSLELGAPQPTVIDGKTYHFFLRPKRTVLPFKLTLKDFRHDRYPGTNIPRNFSSQVHLADPEKNESRDVLIYMNNPLRYGGLTFYQASFGKDDRLSILQVVDNKAWLAPYLACAMVLLGLAIQFLMHLSRFKRHPA